MLNRNIPVYEGNLPYLYACYSPEDEMLVLPILARMYNEGFRVWSASLCDKVSDFVAVRHVSTSSCVIMFMSHNMVERINSGAPEVLAACRSALLRTVVLLDDARPDNRMFPLTVPEYLEYQRSNDSSFWLYAYSADYLERCRGPWPEVKISMREPVYEDVQQEAIAAEYISLENIITHGTSEPVQPAQPAGARSYPNNRGYIAPKADGLTYQPLEKVEAAKTTHDRDFDDAMALLSSCAEKQIDIIINHTRPGQNTVAAKPSLSPLKPLADKRAEMENIRRELQNAELPAERPRRSFDPQVATKADMVVQPEEPVMETEAVSEQKEPIATIPQPDLTVSSIADSIRRIAEAADEPQEVAEQTAPETSAEQAAPETAAEEVTSVPQYEKQKISFEPTVEIIWDDRKTAAQAAEKTEEPSVDIEETAADAGKATVQVVVRKAQPVVRVTPVKKRIVTEPARSAAQPAGTRAQLSRRASQQTKVSDVDNTSALEEYIRQVAIAAVTNADASAEAEQPVSHRRFGRGARAAEVPAETVAVEAAQPAAPAVTAEPRVRPAAEPEAPAAETAAPEAGEEKVSRRKSRYPHNSEVLTGLIAALRRERMNAAEAVSEETAEVEPAAEELPLSAELPESAAAEEAVQSPLKVIKLSDAISERKVSDLQAAVNKFMCMDNAPETAPMIVRAYMRRR